MVNDKQGDSGKISPISEVDLEAIRLRFEGASNSQLSAILFDKFKLEVTPKTVGNWFCKGGRLHEFYKDYAKSEALVRQAVSLDLFRAHLDGAVKTLLDLMVKSKSDMIKYLAAKEIINRQLGEPKKVIQADVNNPAKEILEGAGILLNDGGKDTETN